jgi:hypothetical protein
MAGEPGNRKVGSAAVVTGHRHGSRVRTLTGTFGKTEIAVPRARLNGKRPSTKPCRRHSGTARRPTCDIIRPRHSTPAPFLQMSRFAAPLRANDGETSESLKFSLEGEGQPSWSCNTRKLIPTVPPGPVVDRRPSVVPAPAATAPEMSDRPRRRTFTAQTKLRVLAETDGADGVGGIGAILRREGLYSSTLTDWRRTFAPPPVKSFRIICPPFRGLTAILQPYARAGAGLPPSTVTTGKSLCVPLRLLL